MDEKENKKDGWLKKEVGWMKRIPKKDGWLKRINWSTCSWKKTVKRKQDGWLKRVLLKDRTVG